MFLLDTNILSELMKKRPSSNLVEKLNAVPLATLCTASVCVMEMRYGALRVPNGEDLWSKIQERILSKLRVMNFTYKEALKAADILSHLHSSGKPIGVEDIMIASIALSNGLVVVSANTRHFERIPGLTLQNWLRLD
jgi:tRNA(fMet)-specific endonuclease VapC